MVAHKMSLDYALMSTERKVGLEGISFISERGYYLGDSLTMVDDTLQERIEMRWQEGGGLAGFFTRAGTEVERTIELDASRFAWDLLLVDQLELYLARQDLAIGDSISDTVYVPQSLVSASVKAFVREFGHREIYKGKFDSVFVIEFYQPQRVDAYFTPDKELVRFDIVDRRIRAYLDLDRIVPLSKRPPGESSSEVGLSAFSAESAVTAFLLLGIGTVILLLFGMSQLGSNSGRQFLILGLLLAVPATLGELFIAESTVALGAVGSFVTGSIDSLGIGARAGIAALHMALPILLVAFLWKKKPDAVTPGRTLLLGAGLAALRCCALTLAGGGDVSLTWLLAEASLMTAIMASLAVLPVMLEGGPIRVTALCVVAIVWHLVVYRASILIPLTAASADPLILAGALTTALGLLGCLAAVKRAVA
jgi:hypothetical protein